MKHLFFADTLVGLIFKSLLNSSKRHMPVIFGNILTKTEERKRARGKTDGKMSFIPFPCCITIIISWGTNLVTCPFENYSLSIRCSPMKVTHPEACLCDSVCDSLMAANTHTLPQLTPHPQSKCLLLSYDSAGLWASHLLINLNGHPFSWVPDVINNLTSNHCGYMSMLKTARHIINQCLLSIFMEESTVKQWLCVCTNVQ